ncbi:hypothetical protein F8388_018186 [Cannabis sativa]|uniref:Flavin-containing monooxygenase n=1 Tax=Cannabis sativa TaxID=3483 RepID=A0A7J6GB85_CANSA|nr:hypothetical protein F8388_018186 [Cannabis sativa]
MGELVGNFQDSTITHNQPQNEGYGNIKENMEVNGEESTLNVSNRGNFYDSSITNVIDSKRRRPDSVGKMGKGYHWGLQKTTTPIPTVPGPENFTVNSLFQTHSRSWDADVVNDLFTPDDAALILGIQIKQAVEDDFWYWFAERNGLYSVRSAYQLIQDHKQPPIPSEGHLFWNKLWSFKVPPKTKDLVWRAASNCLATKVNLCIKKVLTDNKCPLCGVFAEIELHLLVSCQFAWACWEFSGFNAADRNPVSLLSWFNFNAARMDDEKLGRVVMLCWAIWSARNDFLWKNRVRSVKNVVEFAQSSLHQFLKAQGKSNLPPLSPPKPGDGSEVWIKPTVGIKLNVDATLFEQDLKHGFGCTTSSSPLRSSFPRQLTSRFLRSSAKASSSNSANFFSDESSGLFPWSFPGVVLHSTGYKSGKEFREKKILVVGSGNSGMEISLVLANHGAKTSLIIRSPWVLAMKIDLFLAANSLEVESMMCFCFLKKLHDDKFHY